MVSERTELTIPVVRVSNLKYSKKVASVVLDFNMEICGREGLTLNDIQRIVDDVHELTLRPIQEQFLNQLSTSPSDSTDAPVNMGVNVMFGSNSYKENSLEGRLLSVLTRTPEMVGAWKVLIAEGGTDDMIEVRINLALGSSYSNGAAGVAYLSYTNTDGEPKLFLAKRLGDIPDTATDEPKLRGEKLIAKVRDIFAIPKIAEKSNGANKAEAQPEGGTSSKKNSKKTTLPKTAGAKARAGRSRASVN